MKRLETRRVLSSWPRDLRGGKGGCVPPAVALEGKRMFLEDTEPYVSFPGRRVDGSLAARPGAISLEL